MLRIRDGTPISSPEGLTLVPDSVPVLQSLEPVGVRFNGGFGREPGLAPEKTALSFFTHHNEGVCLREPRDRLWLDRGRVGGGHWRLLWVDGLGLPWFTSLYYWEA